jgi:hypothetical protein
MKKKYARAFVMQKWNQELDHLHWQAGLRWNRLQAENINWNRYLAPMPLQKLEQYQCGECLTVFSI